MSKTYQKSGRRDESGSPEGGAAVTVLEQVVVSLTKIAESDREELLAFAVGAGLQVMQTWMPALVARR